jgi:hypothetical protein
VVFIFEKSKSYFLGDFFECWGKIFLHCVGACKRLQRINGIVFMWTLKWNILLIPYISKGCFIFEFNRKGDVFRLMLTIFFY